MEKPNNTMSTDWIPGAGVGLLGSIGAWILSWRISSARFEGQSEAEMQAIKYSAEDRTEGVRQDIQALRDDFKAGVAEMRTAAVGVATLQASQDKVNLYTAEAIKGIVSRQDRHEEKLNDHAATLKLVTELLTREQNIRRGT